MNVLKVIGCSMALCALPLSGQTGGGTELFRDMKAPQHERIMDLWKKRYPCWSMTPRPSGVWG